MATGDHRFWGNVRVILRNEQGLLATELVALTGFSLQRAMDSVEGSLDPAACLRITREVIEPLELARECILSAAMRKGSAERVVIPGDIADLCRCQYHALCLALSDPSFPVNQLPPDLEDPIAACARFHSAAGIQWPGELNEAALDAAEDHEDVS